MNSKRLNMLKGYIILFIITLSSIWCSAQKAQLYVGMSSQENQTVEIRIYTPDFQNTTGIHIYRKEEGKDWKQLTQTPLLQKTESQASKVLQEETLKYFKMVSNKENELSGLFLVFLSIQVIQDRPLADALGLRYQDTDVHMGKSYQYKIVDAKTNATLAESESLHTSPYKGVAPPDSLRLDQNNNLEIAMHWFPEPKRFFAIDIYRSKDSIQYQKLNKKPVLLTRITNKEGVKVWPTVNYTDEEVQLGNTYYYRFKALDYLGNSGQYSKTFKIDFRDKIPPPAPYAVKSKVDDDQQLVDISWKNKKVPDLMGFKCIMKEPGSDAYKLIETVIHPNMNFTQIPLKNPGKHSLQVIAIDTNNLETVSEKIEFTLLDKQAPEALQNLRVSIKENEQVVLEWNATTDSDLLTYRVFRKALDAKKYTLISANEFYTTQFIDVIPKLAKTKFQYYVVALDSSYNLSKPSNIVITQLTDVYAPSKPFLKDVARQENKFNIYWLANLEADLAAYKLYIIQKEDTTIISQIDKNQTTYLYQPIEQKGHFTFLLTAVDSSGNESSFSNDFRLSNNISDIQKGSIHKFKVKWASNKNLLHLSWKYEGKEPIGYIIYKSGDNQSFRPVTGMIKDFKYSLTDQKPGTYSYKVVAFYEDGTKVKSEVIEITIQSK